MLVFKFGGASVKDAKAVKNLAEILRNQDGKMIIVVVSAMGKMTNAFEKLTSDFRNHINTENSLNIIKEFHFNIVNDLFLNKKSAIYQKIDNLFKKLAKRLENEPSMNYNFDYDQIVCFGELLSTTIISEYLNDCKIINSWIDIRKVLKTNSIYREAKVDFDISESLVLNKFTFIDINLYITQGFIGSDLNNLSTTLGREGSDYTASALAYFVNAENVTIWKDVAGVYNGDPKLFTNVKVLDKISYQEAIELAYFGAKVIHPKTIQPIQNKNIPLFVRSFLEPESKGTLIGGEDKNQKPDIPIYIVKNNQILISISAKDFSFIAEDSLGVIFSTLAKYRIKVNLMQNSAISFSICVDNEKDKIIPFIQMIKKDYKVLYNNNLKLITIRHYTNDAVNDMTSGKKIYIRQLSRHTARFVTN